MVFLAGLDVGRDRDLAQVDRHVVDEQAARLHQQVLLIHVAQVVHVHRRRHARGIGVPEQQVEREGVLAHQVVADHERPDEVVGAQHVEGGRHLGAVEIALLAHHLFDAGELVLVDEHAELARLGEVDLRGEEGAGRDPVIAACRHVGKRGRHQGAADAIADRRDLLLAGRLLDGVERRERPQLHIVLERQLAQPLVGIDPGDHEHGVAVLGRPLDEGVLRLEIEDVELVDPGRHDQERHRIDLVGQRRVLDQLHQLVLEDDLAQRGGDVLAHLEGLHVGLADRQPTLATLEVGQQVLQTLDEVLAFALDGRLHDLRIGEREVRRRHRVDELARVEVDLLRRLVVDALDLLDRALQPARGEEIGLLEVVEDDLVLPCRIVEALVALGGLGHRLDFLAHHALRSDAAKAPSAPAGACWGRPASWP